MASSAVTEEYRNADNGSQSLVGASFTLLALTTVFFGCFLASRYYNEAGISTLMFWLIVLAYIFNAGNAIDNALSAMLGDAGHHVSTLSHSTNIASSKIGKAADYLYIPSAILPKLAMLAFYYQVFPGRIYRWTIYGSASLLVCTLIAGLLQTTLICKPFSAYWQGGGKCGDLMATYRWLSWPNLLTDLVMLIMPFPVLLRLQVSRATKIKLIMTFVAGSLGIITSILRMIAFYIIPIFTDPTWYLIQPSIYSVVEPSAYLICAIMPTLRHLSRRIARSIGVSTSTFHGYHSSYTRNPTTHAHSNGTFSRLRSKLSIHGTESTGKTAAENGASKEDLELGRVGLSPKVRHSAWNRTAVGTGMSEGLQKREGMKEGLPGEIVCQTDIDMFIEPASRQISETWSAKEKDESSDSLEAAEVRSGEGADGFGDEVPLQGRMRRGDASQKLDVVQ